jgi:tetratricopeptide (TPR) repeat protein
MKPSIFKVLACVAMAAVFHGPADAQSAPPAAPATMGLAAPSTYDSTSIFGSVVVYVRSEDGQPLPRKLTPVLSIIPAAGGRPLASTTLFSSQYWTFSGIEVGSDYVVQVTADGYQPGQEKVHLANHAGASASVIVFMHPVEQALIFHPPTGQFVLAPRAEKEIQHALEDLRANRVSSAQKHAGKALQISPDNPYCQYVMGLTYLLTNQIKQAKPYLEKSVSIDSSQAPALTALGTVRYRLGDNAGAALVLSKAVQLDATSWKAEWLLAASYAGEKNYAEARDHANQALKVGKSKAGQVQLVLGEALAGLGDREGAAKAFEAFARQFPKDPNASKALEWAKMMRQPVVDKSLPGTARLALLPEPPLEIPPRPDWAPPDVDSVTPFVVSGGTCPLPQILENAGKNAEQLVTNLQEFSATEDFQEIEIKRGGQLEKPAERDFKYLVLIDQVSPQAFDVKEFRNEGSTQVQLPGRIQDTGVAALALALHPIIQPDLDWKCEGLGTWSDQPAWVVHFQQKPKAPDVLSWFSGPMHSYALPLKGRVWISERSNQVLHLETDLVKEIKPIDLKREHFSIDYAPVSFTQHDVQLWLPENVDTYIQFEGHFLHYYHHFSNFQLFWVGTTQKIGAPKDEKRQDQ